MLSRNGFLTLVKGFITGLLGLVEGISYSSILVSLGLYNDAIDSVNGIFKKDVKKLCNTLLPILAGIILMTIASKGLMNIVNVKYKNQAIFFCMGLMLGSFKLLCNKEKQRLSLKRIAFMIFVFLFTIFSQLLLGNVSINVTNNILINLIVGFLTGLFLLIPGMNQNFWVNIFNFDTCLNDYISNIINFENCVSLLLFCGGIILGLVMVARIIGFLAKRYRTKFLLLVKALLFSAIVLSMFELEKFTFNFVNLFTTFIAFLWGYILIKNLEKE